MERRPHMESEFLHIFEVPDAVRPYVDSMVTEDEAEIVCALHGDPEARIDPEALRRAYGRAVLNKTTEGKYIPATLYDRLGYFTQYERETWQRIPREKRQEIDQWYIGEYTRRKKEAIQQGKTAGFDDVLPLSEAIGALKSMQESGGQFYIVPCNCRTTAGNCRHSVNTCISNDYGPNSQWDRGYGEKIGFSELEQLLRALDKEGLMHTVSREGYACNCETCCCYVFRASLALGSKGVFPRTPFVAQHDQEKCTACGACVRRCHFGAFTAAGRGKIPELEAEKCFGCGICATACPAGAISMINR